MALEAVLFPQDPFGYGCEELVYSMGGGVNNYWGYNDVGVQEADKGFIGILESNHWETSSASRGKEWDLDSSPGISCIVDHHSDCILTPDKTEPLPPSMVGGRRKRRRTKSGKNKEELESQRMNHIAVERNRRKQMNEYLAVLRSLMPSSYVQRGDQASIVGGAINFMKELEQLVQTMEAEKTSTENNSDDRRPEEKSSTSPFSRFFSFPQYSTLTSPSCSSSASPGTTAANGGDQAKRWRSTADIEVTMVETHAHLKVLVKKQPRQLLKMVSAFQSLGLTVLHLNVTTTRDRMVLYSVSVKVEEGSHVNTVDEIATAVNEMLWRIQEEAN